MQAALVLLVIAGSTAWLAVDASKRDWTENSFAKNVPSWVIGSLVLWIVVFPLYVFAHRKKAPLKTPAKAEPLPAMAMAASGPSEQYGPSIDEGEVEIEEPQPEPVVELEPEPDPVVELEAEPQPVGLAEPVVEVTSEPDPVVELEAEPQPVALADPVVEVTPEPVVEVTSEPVVEVAMPAVEIEPEPDPVVELEAAPVVEPGPVAEPVAEPDPVVEMETDPEPVVETEPEPVLEISYPDLPVDEAPPGLSVDAFKDIKPVSFGGVAVEDDEPAQPDPVPAPPLLEPEPVAAVAPEPVPEPEPTPTPEPEPTPEFEPMPIVEPLSYPLDDEPVIAEEPEPSFAAAMAETDVASEPEAAAEPEPEPKKRGFRIPNPQLKLPSFSRKNASSTGVKLPQITLPPNLQGPLTDLERKIALGSVVAIVAAAAFGYSTAPSDETASPAPTAPPAAVER